MLDISFLIFMLVVAGQTTGQNWLTFFWELMRTLGVTYAKKLEHFPAKFYFLNSTGNAGHFSEYKKVFVKTCAFQRNVRFIIESLGNLNSYLRE